MDRQREEGAEEEEVVDGMNEVVDLVFDLIKLRRWWFC